MLLMLFFLSVLTLSLSCFLFMRNGFLIVTISGQSMFPTLQHGDRILVARRWLSGRPRKGQIIVFGELDVLNGNTRDAAHMYYVKRVVALGGESWTTLVCPRPQAQKGETEYITNQAPPYLQTWSIPPAHVFVCGDNAELSVDSRTWGPLPLRVVRGMLLLKLSSREERA